MIKKSFHTTKKSYAKRKDIQRLSYRETSDTDEYERKRITQFLNDGFELISSVVYPVKTGLFGPSYNEFKYIFAKKIRS